MISNINITIPLKDFIQSHLGYKNPCDTTQLSEEMYSSMALSEHIASLLFVLTNNERQHGIFIEMPSEDNGWMKQPRLWLYAEWHRSHERYMIQKLRSHAERVERFIQERNVTTLSRHLMKHFEIDLSPATSMALSMLRKKRIAVIENTFNIKLITKESEL